MCIWQVIVHHRRHVDNDDDDELSYRIFTTIPTLVCWWTVSRLLLHVGAHSYAGSKFHSRDYDNGDDNADGDVDDNASGLKVLGLYASGPKHQQKIPPTLVCTLTKRHAHMNHLFKISWSTSGSKACWVNILVDSHVFQKQFFDPASFNVLAGSKACGTLLGQICFDH